MCTTRWVPSSNSPSLGEPTLPRIASRARSRNPEVRPEISETPGKLWLSASSFSVSRAALAMPRSPKRGQPGQGGRCGHDVTCPLASHVAPSIVISPFTVLNLADYAVIGLVPVLPACGRRNPMLLTSRDCPVQACGGLILQSTKWISCEQQN